MTQFGWRDPGNRRGPCLLCDPPLFLKTTATVDWGTKGERGVLTVPPGAEVFRTEPPAGSWVSPSFLEWGCYRMALGLGRWACNPANFFNPPAPQLCHLERSECRPKMAIKTGQWDRRSCCRAPDGAGSPFAVWKAFPGVSDLVSHPDPWGGRLRSVVLLQGDSRPEQSRGSNASLPGRPGDAGRLTPKGRCSPRHYCDPGWKGS